MSAAHRMSVDITIGSEETNVLAASNPSGYLTISTLDFNETIKTVRDFQMKYPLNTIIGIDDQSAVIAAQIAEALALPHNSVASVSTALNKYLMRENFKKANIRQPRYNLFSVTDDPKAIDKQIGYPCVVKPLTLSASRGVIRADNEYEFLTALQRVVAILQMPDVTKDFSGASSQQILVEEYIPGEEFALEGLLSDGNLKVLAIFDKPDPLEGPFFEETIYVTPSHLSSSKQLKIVECVQQATNVLGLQNGPIHAELRINERGIWILEIAARSIGGYCSRSLQFTNDKEQISLEELILRHALGMKTNTFVRETRASGVMMIPIQRAGLLKEVKGLKSAKDIKYVEDVIISIPIGQPIVPLPEESRYLGFIFARADHPHDVEKALREAYLSLKFDVH